MSYCAECGAYNEENSQFCASCGAPMKKVGETHVPVYTDIQPSGDMNEEFESSDRYDQQPPYSEKPGIFDIYQKAMAVLAKKPFRLWGISLLSGLISFVLGILFGFALGVGIAIDILISVGMTMVFLHGYRDEEVHAVQLFDAFKDGATIKRTLGGMAWMKMWIFLWCLIPIVGPIFAIIRSYEYRLTPYILVTEPDIKATEAIKVSKERTYGWKGKMFAADFVCGIILVAISIVLGLLGNIPVIGNLFMFILVLYIIIISLFTDLFYGLVHAAFYEEIKARS